MITLTTEQAQQIEEALYGARQGNASPTMLHNALATIRAARAQAQVECKECGAKQAQIDRLMLEYCPDDMTPEQMQEWGNNQRPAKQAGQEPVEIQRFGLNPDNGLMYESERGPWCLYKDIALIEPAKQKPVWSVEECDRVVKTLRYIQGIAERGFGRAMWENESLEQFVLGYVKQLEAAVIYATRAQEQAGLCPLCCDGQLYEHTMYRCKGCGSELVDARLMDKNKALAEQALSKVVSDEHCKGLGEELHKLAKHAEQEPVACKAVPVEPTEDMLLAAELSQPRGYRELYGTMINAAPVEPVKQEPVAIDWDTIHQVLCEVWGRDSSADEGLEAIQDLIYAAPVRTKDPTELLDIMVGMSDYIDKLGGDSKKYRAIIAAYREKNK